MLLEPIGRGGMGRVWKGTVRSTGEAVAVKVLNPELAADPEVVARFLQERGILVGLDHPHLVGVHDLVAEGGTLAIVMDLVQGSDLRRYLGEKGPLAPAFAAGLMAQVLTGLAAVHGAGIVHRDLKPENILLDLTHGDPPCARLSDFGIARLTTGPGLTRTTGLIGTPEYMAPEMAEEVEAGPPADIYAAGIVLYELLAGRTPFAGGAAVAILRRHVDEPPARPEGLPDALWQLLSEMLAKRPDQRPDAARAAERLVALVPALLASAPAAAEGGAGTDPNATRLPGYHPGRRPGEAVDTGRMAVPMPLGGARPQRATAAAGDQQPTMLPGRDRVPLAFGGPTPAARPGSRRTAVLIAGGVIAALLVTLLSIGLLTRSGSSHATAGPASSSQPSGGGAPGGGAVAPPAQPTSGKLNGGDFDTTFDHDTAGFMGRDGTMDVRWIPAGAEGPAHVEFTSLRPGGVSQRTGAAPVTWVALSKYMVTALIRSHSGAKITGTIQLSSFVNGALQDRGLKFSAGKDWATLTTANSPLKQGVSGVGLMFTIIRLDAPGAVLDMRTLAYTYSS
jgi:serine/threonine-protein kinase